MRSVGSRTKSEMRSRKKKATTMPAATASAARMMRLRNSSRCSRKPILPSSRSPSGSSGWSRTWALGMAPRIVDAYAIRTRRLFDEAITGVSVVIDAVLPLQFLDVAERSHGVRAHAVVRVQQDFFETAAYRHPSMRSQIHEQRRQPLFEPHGHVDALDRQRWT